MAYSHPSNLFFIALFIIAASNFRLAHGNIDDFSVIQLANENTNLNVIRLAHDNIGLSVQGRLCCTSTGDCPGRAIAGVVVRLNCVLFLGPTRVGEATSNATGFFNINVPGFDRSQRIVGCIASVQLPLNAAVCRSLSDTGGFLSASVPASTNPTYFIENWIRGL